ncbi:hypothetical protein vseg_016815 [Gypsophila vaccaria]
MTNSNPSNPNPTQKPEIIIHRIPAYSPTLFQHLSNHFTLVDPTSTVGPDREAYKTFLQHRARSARAVFCMGLSPLDKPILDCLPAVEVIVGSAAGTDHIDLVECRRRGIAVTNNGDAFSDDVADCAVGLLVDVFRKISASDRFIRAGSWPRLGEYPLGLTLKGKRVGIVGLGSIGSRIAKRLVPFDCRIAYTSRSKKPSVAFPYYDSVHSLALDSDVLILCCTLTDQTHRVVNKDVMTALGEQGVLINVGRGGLVDESEMVRFLVEGKLGGAGLDVFENEPSVPKELFGLDNVVLSPHNAVLTPESLQASKDAAVANLLAFFSNKPLLSPV